MSGFSYGKNKALDEKRKEKQAWNGMKKGFMADFYFRQALKGVSLDKMLEAIEYAFGTYREVNNSTDEEMLKLAMTLADRMEFLVEVWNNKIIRKGN